MPGDGSWGCPHSTSTTTLVRSRGPLRPASLHPAWPVGCAWVCKGPQAYSHSKMSVTLFTFRPMGSVVKGFLKSGPESALANFQGSPAPMERRTEGVLRRLWIAGHWGDIGICMLVLPKKRAAANMQHYHQPKYSVLIGCGRLSAPRCQGTGMKQLRKPYLRGGINYYHPALPLQVGSVSCVPRPRRTGLR